MGLLAKGFTAQAVGYHASNLAGLDSLQTDVGGPEETKLPENIHHVTQWEGAALDCPAESGSPQSDLRLILGSLVDNLKTPNQGIRTMVATVSRQHTALHFAQRIKLEPESISSSALCSCIFVHCSKAENAAEEPGAKTNGC